MDRKAKIIATLGPSSEDEATIRRLILAGMDCGRLNFSHGTHEYKGQFIRHLRKLSAELAHPFTVIQDLPGPKLRVGDLPDEGVMLLEGNRVFLTSSPQVTFHRDDKTTVIPLNVPDLEKAVKEGSRILLDDGNLELLVISTSEDRIETQILLGGLLFPRKGINLPRANLNIPNFTEKDAAGLKFGLEQGVDAVMISFVRNGADIEYVRQIMRSYSAERSNTPIIAKIETPEAMDNLEEVIQASDGVIVARGDLAIETSGPMIPIYQKMIVDEANRQGKYVIVATQMLDSMIENPRPTRAELTDVANAIFDGADAIMLSNETACGKFPVEAVTAMSAIAHQAELNYYKWGRNYDFPSTDDSTPSARMIRQIKARSSEEDAAAIVIFSKCGQFPWQLSKAHIETPIYVFTPNEAAYQQTGLLRGIHGVLTPSWDSSADMIDLVEKHGYSTLGLQQNQWVLIANDPYDQGKVRPDSSQFYRLGI